MSIETLIFEALRGLVADQVYPDLNDDGTDAPYIVYQRVGGVTPTFLEAASPSKEAPRVQVTSWDKTRDGAVSLARQAKDALVALGAKPAGDAISLHDPDTKLRGSTQDFIVWTDL